jgi:hypothetical protein
LQDDHLYGWTSKQLCYFILKMCLNVQNLHIWKPYLTLELVKQDKSLKYNGSSILLCPTFYCVKQFTISTKILCPAYYCVQHFIVSSNLLYQPISLVDKLWPFHALLCVAFFSFWNNTLVNISWKQGHLCPMHIFFHFLGIQHLR